MWMLRCLVVALAVPLMVQANHQFSGDFFLSNTLPDGEVEYKIFRNGVTAKETTVKTSFGLKFRQLAPDRHHLIQLIYDSNDVLKDCEVVHQVSQVRKFLHDFNTDLNVNLTTIQDWSQLSWMNYTKLREDCKKRHRELKQAARQGRSRRRRDLSDLLRVPGTKWCGKGYSADKYTRLGAFSSTDKCCRRHDMGCPFWIGAFDTKYGLFNWRVNTIMHCSCDERFRACLKMVDSSDANLVGKLFFNIVQSKCFVLKPKKRCVRRSWWGKCEKYKYDKRAILRDNIPY